MMKLMQVCLFLIAVVFSSCKHLAVSALPEEFTYVVNGDKTITITGYNGRNKDLVVPSTIDGYSVTGIAPDSFRGKGNGFDSFHLVDSLVLPDGLVNIGANAFAYNKISELKIPDSVTYIGSSAFAYNLISELKIPDSVHLDDAAFIMNPIQTLVLSSGIASIGKKAFSPAQDHIVIKGDGLRIEEEQGLSQYFISAYEAEAMRGGVYRIVKKPLWGARIWARFDDLES